MTATDAAPDPDAEKRWQDLLDRIHDLQVAHGLCDREIAEYCGSVHGSAGSWRNWAPAAGRRPWTSPAAPAR
ncbi:hypothetical protein ACFC58_43040, partial [Kitasatospora purpeofusca]|uniref:hypothetical protein n=1 Tax=Kitasatospora purpeofusca TaxID=67352 RepID=UPI0035D663E7